MGLEKLRLTEEVTYGTYVTSPAAGKQFNLYLPEGDAFSVRTVPEYWEIRDSGQGNRLVKKQVGRKPVSGSIQTYLFPSQTVFLLGLATRLDGTAPCFKLPSFSADHMTYLDETCTKIGKRYVGLRMVNPSISCSDSGQGVLVMFKADVIGSLASDITITDYPNPTLSSYPEDDPYLIFHTAENSGQLFIDDAREGYKKLDMNFANVVKPFGGEKRYNSRVGYFGRTCTFSTTLLQKSNVDRAAYEEGQKVSLKVVFDDGLGNTLTVDFGTNVSLDRVTDRRPLDDYFTQDLGFTALVDPTITTPTDLTVTVTAPAPP
jgi:hypothetical protein